MRGEGGVDIGLRFFSALHNYQQFYLDNDDRDGDVKDTLKRVFVRLVEQVMHAIAVRHQNSVRLVQQLLKRFESHQILNQLQRLTSHTRKDEIDGPLISRNVVLLRTYYVINIYSQ